MTKGQIGILAGLGIILIILVSVIARTFLTRSGMIQAGSSNPTPRVQATSTMIVLPTLTPTATSTPVPYEQLIPAGWKQFKNELVELWLPPQYKLGDAKKLAADAKKRYEETGLQELNDYNAESKTFYTFVIVDEESGSELFRTITSVGYEPLPQETLDLFLDTEIARLPYIITVVERRKVNIEGKEAVRLVYETRQGNINANELIYVFLDGSTVWSVSYYAEINEYYQQLPLFEQSIKTFRFVR